MPTKKPPRPTTKTPHRSKGQRFSAELRQEHRSLDQLSERLDEYGWLVNVLPRDLGEDVLVSIYDGGNFTGLSFFVQCKSTVESNKLIRKRDPDHLRYPLDVHDLLHWEDSAQLVVVVVWDVGKRCGWWETVPAIISDLEKANPAWRRKGSVTVSLSSKNTTGDASLARLRHVVADRSFPVVSKGKEIMIRPTFLFPRTGEGQQRLAELRRAIDTGTPVTIESEYIKEVRLSPWIGRMYGVVQPESLSISSALSDRSVTLRLEAESKGGSDSILLHMKLVRAGRVEHELSNDHDDGPIKLRVVMNWADEGDVKVSTSLTNTLPHPVIYHTRDAASFLLRLRRATRVRCILQDKGSVLFESGSWTATGQTESELRWWKRIADMLCVIQPRIQEFGTLSLKNPKLSDDDVEAITKMYEICRSGRVKVRVDFAFTLAITPRSRKQWESGIEARRSGAEPNFEMRFSDGKIKVLNVEVPIKEMVARVPDPAPIYEQVRRALDQGLKEVRVNCPGLRVVEEYPDWIPKDMTSDSGQSQTRSDRSATTERKGKQQ